METIAKLRAELKLLQRQHGLLQADFATLEARQSLSTSTELRTPMAIIQSSTELLKYYGARLRDDERMDVIDQLEHSVQRVERILHIQPAQLRAM